MTVTNKTKPVRKAAKKPSRPPLRRVNVRDVPIPFFNAWYACKQVRIGDAFSEDKFNIDRSPLSYSFVLGAEYAERLRELADVIDRAVKSAADTDVVAISPESVTSIKISILSPESDEAYAERTRSAKEKRAASAQARAASRIARLQQQIADQQRELAELEEQAKNTAAAEKLAAAHIAATGIGPGSTA